MPSDPQLLALDFDGVVCDGMAEYFHTAWGAYRTLIPDSQASPDLAAKFARLRPVVESGWEMPLVIHGLCLGFPEETLLNAWPSYRLQIEQDVGLTPLHLAQTLDHVRDRWIQEDLAGWLSLHRFYPGVIQRLQTLQMATDVMIAIITTKEKRFVEQLLAAAGVHCPLIFGKETKQSKATTLQELQQHLGIDRIWFVEDRLQTLQGITQVPKLSALRLFLADWGYNTPAEQATAHRGSRIQLLSLDQFVLDFTQWP